MFLFNDLLRDNGIPPQETAIILHTPGEGKLARLLPFLAETEPEILEAYQSVHGPLATATLRNRKYVVSFVRTENGRLSFVGAFQNLGVGERPTAEICSAPAMRRVIDEFGANAELEEEGVASWPFVKLERLPTLKTYIGRIEIAPKLTQTYVRLAERLNAEIVAFSPQSTLSASAPDWREFIVTGPEVRVLPSSWQARLREWRGIYLIVDENDGARHVGSAYGAENLLGRWRTHVHGAKGVAKELGKRDSVDFRFSILERVSPDTPPNEVIALEHSWMARLHTRQFGLNS